MKPLMHSMLLAAVLLVGVAAAPPADDGFLSYWARFRAAALGGDMNRLATMTRFPLRAGFDSDQDHPRPITRARFPRYFKTELGCPSIDTGSNLDAIRRRTRPDPAYDSHDGHNATMGRFAFERTGGQWHLATINYGDPSEYLDRLKGRC